MTTQTNKDRVDKIRDIGRRIASESKIPPVLQRLRMLRVSSRHIDLELHIAKGTASEWMGGRRKVPARWIAQLVKMEVAVCNDLCHYIRTGDGSRLFSLVEKDSIEFMLCRVRSMRMEDSSIKEAEQEVRAAQFDNEGVPIFGAPW